ncbi:MFS transporter [Nocardia zapadnayensis]|uniref:MFS transporter n=1 Tax=Nocardia rhamnosiphila TaxID=426716 RepID=UPI0022454921|nr:MFS transporter [Nocardia zapadnayensis]MCX0272804.1 MFS transporter [Nocardia zapadnayensis]
MPFETPPDPAASASPAPPRRQARRASLAGMLGTLVEYYDFSVYAFLAVIFAPSFFPAGNPAVATLGALLVFASAYLVRPLGGIAFGWIGDRAGRRTALTATVLLMGFASVVIGLLPTYASIGIFAPILLVLLRLLQGFSAGGELVGALTLVAESATPRRRGLMSSLTPAGSSLGFALATGVVGATAFFVGQDAMEAWGWRIPFLLCLPLTVICLLVRVGLDESPEFERVDRQTTEGRRPVREVLRDHKAALVVVTVLAFALNTTGYVGLTYVAGFLRDVHGFSTAMASTLSAIVIAVSCVVGMPLGGILTDRFGRRAVCICATATMAVLALPMFLLMQSTSDTLTIGGAYLVIMVLNGIQTVAGFSLYTSIFPTRVRYTGTAIGHNLGLIVGGGFTPYIAAQLVLWSGQPVAPALWMIAGSIVGIIAVAASARIQDLIPDTRSVTGPVTSASTSPVPQPAKGTVDG